MMMTLTKTKNFAVNCRCGKRSVWRVPVDLAQAAMHDTPVEIKLSAMFKSQKKEMAGDEGRTLIAIKGLVFECVCGRFFELTSNGLMNITDGAKCDDWMQRSPSKMVN